MKTYLPCDCCGSAEGAESDEDGAFQDGQPLLCGCKGHVSVDAEVEPYVLTWCGCGWEEFRPDNPDRASLPP